MERIEAWEREHGRIPRRRVGAAPHRLEPADRSGGLPERRGRRPAQPGFDARASRLLAHDRDVLGVGVETIGTDAGQAGTFDPPFPNHTIMHGAGKFGLASLCNLDQLPPTGAVVIAAPLKIVNGSGSPLRVLAIVARRRSMRGAPHEASVDRVNNADRFITGRLIAGSAQS